MFENQLFEHNVPYIYIRKVNNKLMKVKKKILAEINNPATRTEIAMLLRTGEQNVYVAIKENTTDGRMTKMDFLMAINMITGIPVTEILEVEKG